ncbi:MAG: flocculation-associated PEP-CTERM protein PepA [Geoalkalibacter sp.]|uniref:flocculation-associated PEP-CTERM protein PepA n=1 Tax=Geoalkalibacter sp. TaxID=3041440 RepID=UPI003D0A6A34
MKKVLLLLAAMSLLAATSAPAAFINTYWDLNTVDNAFFPVIGDGVTEAFSEITYYAQTNSIITNTGFISDTGLARATGLNFVSGNSPGDDEGFLTSTGYGFTFAWDDLEGVVTSNVGGVIEALYTSGTFNFYIDYDPYATNFDTPGSFTDGTPVATVDVTSGGYRLDTNGGAGSSYIITGTFTSILDNFWYQADTGADLSDDLLDKGWVFAYTAGDNDPGSLEITVDNDDGSLHVFSTHDSSVSVGVVPEPSTIILLGAGLLGTGVMLRRKNRK